MAKVRLVLIRLSSSYYNTNSHHEATAFFQDVSLEPIEDVQIGDYLAGDLFSTLHDSVGRQLNGVES